jgi:rhodanese-related sulfurtransferase
MNGFFKSVLLTVAFVSAAAASCLAISAEELAGRLDRGDRLTLVDVRGGVFFEQGHIQGAINIPESLSREIRMPPLGEVIVYGDGLDPQPAVAAAAALNEKPGIAAQVLEGGLSRWEALDYPTTRAMGFDREKLPVVSYQKVAAMARNNPDLVLVDLRIVDEPAPEGRTPYSGTGSTSGLTDLGEVFPGARVVRSTFAADRARTALSAAASLKQMDPDHAGVYVLIDNGDGVAQETARKLMAAGVRRFVILAGGEESLARRGRSAIMIRKE